jgi:hypothetical protein
MQSKLLFATGALLGLVVGWLIGRQPVVEPSRSDPIANQPIANQPVAKQADAPAPVMPPPRKPDPDWMKPPAPTSKVLLRLSEVYTNVEQEELKSAQRLFTEETISEWRELKATLKATGRQTAFVVRAATIHAAIDETLEALAKPRSVTHLRPPGKDEIDHLWAFVYLGNASNTPNWNIDAVFIDGSEVWVSYSRVFHVLALGMSFPHGYWIPLGEGHTGTVTLHIVDRTDGQDDCEILTTRTRLER